MTTVEAIPLDIMEHREVDVAERFLEDGYINVPVENRVGLDRIRDRVVAFAAEHIGLPRPEDPDGFLTVDYGTILIFSQTLMHGNRVNQEPGTRWLMNCRFKSVLSPYFDKKLGEFFDSIAVRPATRMGMRYELSIRLQE